MTEPPGADADSFPAASRQSFDRLDVAAVAGAALARLPTLGRSRAVAIDGPAGSGKTTLAAQVASTLEAQRAVKVALLHMDDVLEGWAGLDDTAALEGRLLRQVFEPLAADLPARWQRYDWSSGRLTTWQDLPVPEVLMVEGCGSGALAYSAYVSVLVWVEADRETRLARGVARDGAEVLPQWRRWMDSESRHFTDNRTRERADLRIWTGPRSYADGQSAGGR